MDISKWLVCDGNSQVRTCVITCFDDIKDNGLYYVKPINPSILIDIEGVYIADVVRHALNESLISFGEIAFVLACKTVEYDFAPIVKQVYDTVDDDALSKTVMNHVIGTFVDIQKRSCKVRFSFGSETDACTKAIQSLTNNGALLRPVRLGPDVWKIISNTKTRNKRSTVLMNIQIVQNARLNVYKTANRVSLASGGTVVQIKTDSFTVSNGNRDVLHRFVESNQSVIGGYKMDKYVACHMSRKVQKAPYVRKVPEQTIYDFGGDELPDIKALADLVEQVKRVSLEGFAGTGKTTLLRLLVEELKRRGHETQVASYQNNVAEKMDGKSIHKTYSINIHGERSKNNRVARTAVVIDEQSMIPTSLWEIIEETNHDILVSCGDFDQLPPVNDQTDRRNSDMYRLVFPTIVRLTKVHRTCDPELMRIIDECRHGNTSNVRTSTTAPITKINICDTNRKRRQVNEQVMKSLNLPTTHHFTNVKPSKYKQNFSLSIGMPLIRLNNEECNEKIGSLPEAVKSMANASKWIVKDVQNNTITLARMIDFEETASIVSFEFSPKWFAHVFTPCYCITLYKSQGDTIRQPYTIWEWERMKQDRRYAYVAISRATRLNDITVVM
jgi:nicotinamide riboside kinase